MEIKYFQGLFLYYRISYICYNSLLYVYNEFINVNDVKEKRFKQIKEFIDGHVIKNKEYFEKNECIKTAYTYVKNVIDYMNESC